LTRWRRNVPIEWNVPFHNGSFLNTSLLVVINPHVTVIRPKNSKNIPDQRTRPAGWSAKKYGKQTATPAKSNHIPSRRQIGLENPLRRTRARLASPNLNAAAMLRRAADTPERTLKIFRTHRTGWRIMCNAADWSDRRDPNPTTFGLEETAQGHAGQAA
jgi:hypothetical protein